ncbi:hypothetical protein ACIXNL_20120 [Bacteroides fragilis]
MEECPSFCEGTQCERRFFTFNITFLFTSGSCGLFPTVSASYSIANYSFSGLTVYFDMSFGGWFLKNSLCDGAGYNG